MAGRGMSQTELDDLRRFTYMQSRIPKLDALAAFVPLGEETDAVLQEMLNRTGFSRWFPVPGGHRVLVPHEGGPYDSSRFSIERSGWDHETCKLCRAHIDPMTLCWVTERGPYIILCSRCHEVVLGKDDPERV
jgi:hypothetical protein